MITIHALVPIPNIKQYLFAKVSAGPMGSQVLSWCPSLHIEPRCSGRKNLAKEWMEWMEIGWKIAWQFRKWKRFKNGFNIFGKCDGKTVGLQRCHVGFPNILDDIPMFIGSSWFFASISSEFPDLPSGYLTFNIAMENHHF